MKKFALDGTDVLVMICLTVTHIMYMYGLSPAKSWLDILIVALSTAFLLAAGNRLFGGYRALEHRDD